MKVKLTDDNKFLIVKEATKLELDQLKLSFTKEPAESWIIKKKNPFVNLKRSFINDFNMIPIGLWYELILVCQKFNFQIEFEDDFTCRTQDCALTFNSFKEYIDELFKDCTNDKGVKMTPMHYQLEGVFKLLKFKKASIEVTTSGGKTLMAYCLFKFLKEVADVEKILYIVPNSQLATQSLEKFYLYDNWCGQEGSFKGKELHSGISAKEKKTILDTNILFGTFQSLCKKDAEFFKDFGTVIIDECHHASAQSIKNVLTKCVNADRIFGLTGTFPKDGSFESYQIQSYIGPIVYKLSAFTLINQERFATPIYIVRQLLQYAQDEEKSLLYDLRKDKDKEDITAGSKCLKAEQRYANKSYMRLRYISDLAAKTKQNTLILFGDIKGGYGRKIYDYLREHTDKQVFYSDGGTSSELRDEYKARMEADITGNTILVASIYTFGEGCDIGNLWNIFLVNTAKSDRIVRQIIGRGMRPFKGKDKTVIFDFIDDFRYGSGYYSENYLYRHGKERARIYLANKFPFFTQEIKLENTLL